MIARWNRRSRGDDARLSHSRPMSDQQRIRELEAEVRKLRMEKEILKKATALFVQEKT